MTASLRIPNITLRVVRSRAAITGGTAVLSLVVRITEREARVQMEMPVQTQRGPIIIMIVTIIMITIMVRAVETRATRTVTRPADENEQR